MKNQSNNNDDFKLFIGIVIIAIFAFAVGAIVALVLNEKKHPIKSAFSN